MDHNKRLPQYNYILVTDHHHARLAPASGDNNHLQHRSADLSPQNETIHLGNKQSKRTCKGFNLKSLGLNKIRKPEAHVSRIQFEKHQ